MFHVGQKVVCVDDKWADRSGRNTHLVKNEIYHIIEFGKTFAGSMGLFLAETKTNSGFAFYQWRFRPLIEKKTDISIFTDMLIKDKEFV